MISALRHGPESGQYEGLGEIVMNRPEKRNALTPQMLTDIRARAIELEAVAAVRAIVLRGEGATFCSGFDLTLCRENSDALTDMLRGLSAVVRTMRRCSKPVVVAVRGAAIAGGCALLGGADVVVTHQDAKLGYPVVKLGISPAVTSPFLRLAIGDRATRARLLDPQLIDGLEARRIGLASLCVDSPEDVTPRAQIEAMRLAAKPPGAFATTKKWLNEIEGSSEDPEIDRALQVSLSLVGGDEERKLLGQLWSKESGKS